MNAKDLVIFRMWQGDVIALFPQIPADMQGNVMSYQFIGQHGAANYSYIIKTSIPAAEEEYASLACHLAQLGYYLQITTHEEFMAVR